MTLILTELSSHGIAMAADSAVTFTHPQTGLSYARPNKAQKLHVIPYLRAGIACWGLGTIDELPTDHWVSGFIASHTALTTLSEFGGALAAKLNVKIPPNTSGESRLGFHLAAFESYEGEPTPSFYHIHDGQSEALQLRGISINPRIFNANHDCPPQIFAQKYSGEFYRTRNGDYLLYAQMWGLLESFFDRLQQHLGISIPHSQNILDRAEYLVLQIRTMSEIYRLSNLVPGIGGGVHYLTINKQGIHSQGIRYF